MTNQTRVPPQALEIERSVLGTMMIDQDARDEALELLNVESFYSHAHKLIFEAVSSLVHENVIPDAITVSDQLRKKDQIEAIGNESYLSELVEAVATTKNVGYLCHALESKRKLRGLIEASQSISDQAFDSDADAGKLVDLAESKIFAITNEKEATRFYHPSELVPKISESIETCQKTGKTKGLLTGFEKLDSQTTGFQPGDLIILAGRPSMGKTAFALSVARKVYKRQKSAIAIFSLEMSKIQLIERMVCSESKTTMKRLRAANLSSAEVARIGMGQGTVYNMDILIDDTPAITPMQIRSKLRRLKRKYGISLIIADYLQLMSDSEKRKSRQEEMSSISRQLKGIAKEFDTPFVALSQLSRDCEKRPNKRPMLSDLRESGAIEQDADLVMFCYRDEFYYRDSKDKGVAEIIVGKQRNGPTGMIKLAYNGPHMDFENLSEQESMEFRTGCADDNVNTDFVI